MADVADILAVPGGIADAGRAASAIGDGVRAAGVAGLVRAVGAALPGSRTAAAVPDLATRWQAGLTAVADGFTAHGGALAATAGSYRDNEQQLVQALRTPPPGSLPPLAGPR